ncbi:GNAT family N-acetyltransferase [Lactobacillus sp. YT155]|uniref:GNAT family N-acetyltransferase n=1 Tax=Lactobacillus sp. YT155 TaxID=3060955 RepID=UPI00265EB904|nr:GNAT family N-acetyltransferase [Lactobacillus sp. YT155]MDO1604479.1 GNAT family N-acetyltransferase [Lactobacillus sp. YT155]
MITIKRCDLSSLADLQQISRQTFQETFAPFNSPENLAEYLNQAFNEAKLSAELQNQDSQFYFIYYQEEIAGYLKVNFDQAQTEDFSADNMELQRIYIQQKFQHLGLGQKLFDKALSIAKENHKQAIWLGVWSHNEKALNFYNKQGFVELTQHQFKIGEKIQIDKIMIKNIC